MTSTMIACFLGAVKYGSFAKAATNLYFSQQTVGKQIAQLEKELGVTLFQRTASGVKLTQDGEYYSAIFRESQVKSEFVQRKMAQYHENKKNLITIGCSQWIDPYPEIYPVLMAFQRAHPELTLSFRFYDHRELLSNLKKNHVDLALFSGGHLPEDPAVASVPICNEQIAIIGPDSVIGTTLSQTARKRRRDFPLLVTPGWSRGYMETIVLSRQEISSMELPIDKVIVVPNIETQCAMIQLRQALAFTDLRSGRIRLDEGLGCELLGVDSMLHCCLLAETDNQRLAELVERLRISLTDPS